MLFLLVPCFDTAMINIIAWNQKIIRMFLFRGCKKENPANKGGGGGGGEYHVFHITQTQTDTQLNTKSNVRALGIEMCFQYLVGVSVQRQSNTTNTREYQLLD